MHPHNCFITLTYNQENVPRDGSVKVEHWQKFAKRLRKRLGPFRFLHCGEYGETNYRPHYHALLFGQDFHHDRKLWKSTGANETFTSETLEETWGHGFTTVGHLTWQSAAYVSRYVMKKATKPHSDESASEYVERYGRLDEETGEFWCVKPEYITMSRRPGLAAQWYEKYKSDVYPSDEVVHDGRKHRPPKYYDNLLEAENPQRHESIKHKRRGKVDYANNTPDRLKVREAVLNARLTQLQRKL